MKPNASDVTQINKQLLDIFGKELDGKARFRIVWSDDEKEKRVGIFEEYCGKLFLREVMGAKDVPKYSYIKERWVLERAIHNPSKEILNHNGYEPVYVFQSSNQSYLVPIYKVCEIIIHGFFHPTKSNIEDMTEKKEAERMQKDIDMLEDKCTDFSMLKQLGELVTVPSKFEHKKEDKS